MKNPETRDTLLLAAGLSLLTAGFLMAVVLPGRRAAAQVREETAEAERLLREIPLRMAELQSLHADLRRCAGYLSRTERLVPQRTELHAVIARVDRLARDQGVTVLEVKPLRPVVHESYQALPFQMAFRGSFRGMASFLRGLETEDRLFTFEGLTVSSKTAGRSLVMEGDLHFTVYARHADSTDSAAFNASAATWAVDTGLR